MKRIGVPALLAAMLLAATACGSSDVAKSDRSTVPTTPSTVAAEALRGQTVTVAAHESFAVSPEVLKTFTRQTGIKVRVLENGDAGTLVNRAILTRDHPQADVLYGVDNAFLSRALQHDLFAPRGYQGLDAIAAPVREPFVESATRAVPIDFADVCVDFDIDWFKQHNLAPPRTLEDLTDPRYRDLTVVESPATSSTGLVFMLATVARYGERGWLDYWNRLKRNGVLAVEGWQQAYDGEFSAGAARGARPIVVSYASSPPADVVYSEPKKTTSSVGVMTDGCFRQYEFAAVLQHAAHAQAAQRFVEFMLSRRFQEDMPLQMFVYPARSDAALPEVFTRLAPLADHPLTLAPALINRNREKWIAAWTDAVL